MSVKGYIAFALSEASRKLVLELFPPRHEVVRADHVTFLYGVDKALMPNAAVLTVVAYAAEPGLEALVVAVDGETKRSDGSSYHLTLSREEGRRSEESNALVGRKENWVVLAPGDRRALILETKVVFRPIES